MPSAQRIRWAKIRVVAVSLSALSILSTLLFLLTGGTLFEPKAALYMYMPDAVALVANAPVRVDGIGVGKVKSVELTGLKEPDRVVKVTMIIDRGRLAAIPDDSIAEASADTLIGDKFVDISSGQSARHIPPGGVIAYKASPDIRKRLDMSEFRERMRVMDTLLSDIESGQSPVGKLVQGDQIYQSMRRRVAEFQSGIHALRNTTGAIGKELYSDALYRQIEAPIQNLDLSLAKIQSGQGPLGQFLRDDAQYATLRGSIADLHKAVQDLRGGDFMRSDQQYADWNRGILQLIRTVDEFAANPMMLSTATYENLAGMAKELAAQMKDFRENPRKYLRLKVF